MKTIHGYALVCMALLSLEGCNNQPSSIQQQKIGVVNVVRVPMDFPFEMEYNLSAPPGYMKINEDGYSKFIHPIGTISKLKLYGKDIPLANSQLKDGLLSTINFGEIEVLMSTSAFGAPAIYKTLAFPADIEKLKKAYTASNLSDYPAR